MTHLDKTLNAMRARLSNGTYDRSRAFFMVYRNVRELTPGQDAEFRIHRTNKILDALERCE